MKEDIDDIRDNKIKPEERVDKDIFSKITHNSIPVMGLTTSFSSKVKNISKSKTE